MAERSVDTLEIRLGFSAKASSSLTITTRSSVADGLDDEFTAAGASVSHMLATELGLTDALQTTIEISGPITASGASIATVLRAWWHRNDRKSAVITVGDESFSIEGVSAEEMAELIDRARQMRD